MSQPQPQWSEEYQRYMRAVWSDEHQQYYYTHYVEGQGWVFFIWAAQQTYVPQPPQPTYVTASPPYLQPTITSQFPDQTGYEEVRNPRNFFKVARIFKTLWSEPDGLTGRAFTKPARFVVVKSYPTYSVCLRISTYSGQATTKHGVIANQHAPVIRQGEQPRLLQGESLSGQSQPFQWQPFQSQPSQWQLQMPIEIKVENEEIDISPESRINFAKPYTIEHNVKVKNIGRVVGESVRQLEIHLAHFLGFQVIPKELIEYANETPY